jgi:2,5-diamino-6-(ribosylamino)-4(3H)-pyrimidinone 5'-phosphate reductase
MAAPDGSPLAISSREDFARVHRLRAASDAILVGVNTVIADDPSLVVKEEFVKGARNPLRVVLDSNGRTPDGARVLDGRAKTVIFTGSDCTRVWKGADAVRAGNPGDPRVSLGRVLDELGGMGVKRLMVEGGGTVIREFLRLRLADEVKVFVGEILVGGDGPALAKEGGIGEIAGTAKLKLAKTTQMPGGVLLEYERG